jgi:hypothetical protein
MPLQENDSLERKVLHIGVSNCPFGRRGLTKTAFELYGREGKVKAIELWKKGAFNLNQYGYANLSKRGFTLYDKGVLPEKASPKPKVSIAQMLDYIWKNNQKDFKKWLSANQINLIECSSLSEKTIPSDQK